MQRSNKQTENRNEKFAMLIYTFLKLNREGQTQVLTLLKALKFAHEDSQKNQHEAEIKTTL